MKIRARFLKLYIVRASIIDIFYNIILNRKTQ